MVCIQNLATPSSNHHEHHHIPLTGQTSTVSWQGNPGTNIST